MPKADGDSGNWRHGLEPVVMALSPKIMHLCWSVCEKPGQQCQRKKEKKHLSALALLHGGKAHKGMCQDFSKIRQNFVLQSWSCAILI